MRHKGHLIFLPLQAKDERLHSGLPHQEVIVTFGYGEGSLLPNILCYGREVNSYELASKPSDFFKHMSCCI